jgi:hypothetical protein
MEKIPPIFNAIKVFPSPEIVEDTAITNFLSVFPINSKFVLIVRNASENLEFIFLWINS